MKNYCNLATAGKALFVLLFSAFLAVTLFPLQAIAEESVVPEDGITTLAASPVNKTMAQAFPDIAFRTYVIENVLGKSADDILDDTIIDNAMADTIAAHKEIEVDGKGISSLSGIEYFTSLTVLDCVGNGFSALDVSNNLQLKSLSCGLNLNLGSIDVGSNRQLEYLNCGLNPNLGSIDVRNNTALIELVCHYSALSALDVSNNKALVRLACYNNELSALDVSENINLEELYCDSNKLTELNVSNNTALTKLSFSENQISRFDISAYPNIEEFECSGNPIAELDVSGNPRLTRLVCSFMNITELDLSKNLNLTFLDCSENALTKLDVSKNGNLVYFNCESNNLTEIDVSGNTLLDTFNFSKNPIENIDISALSGLFSLTCEEANLTQLDVSNNAVLGTLSCSWNSLTELDVSNNPGLFILKCTNNALSDLDISQNLMLESVRCNDNKLTVLQLPGSSQLTRLYCSNNLLTTLDIAATPELRTLDCSGNRLLSIQGFPEEMKLRSFSGDNQAIIVPLGVSASSGYESIANYELGGFVLDALSNVNPASLLAGYDDQNSGRFFSSGEGSAGFTSSCIYDADVVKLEGTIEFILAKYAVSFVDWDGALIESQEVIHGADALLPADPKREGYTFGGWSVSHTSIIQDTTLTALYTQNPGTDTGGSKLAKTGDNSISALGVGLLVFLSGSVLITGARRKKD